MHTYMTEQSISVHVVSLLSKIETAGRQPARVRPLSDVEFVGSISCYITIHHTAFGAHLAYVCAP